MCVYCAGDVKSAITKGGGKPADSGSVMFNFMRQGQVLVSGADEDELFEAAIEAGADDVQPVFDEEGQPTSDFKVRRGGDGQAGSAADSSPSARLFKLQSSVSALHAVTAPAVSSAPWQQKVAAMSMEPRSALPAWLLLLLLGCAAVHAS